MVAIRCCDAQDCFEFVPHHLFLFCKSISLLGAVKLGSAHRSNGNDWEMLKAVPALIVFPRPMSIDHCGGVKLVQSKQGCCSICYPPTYLHMDYTAHQHQELDSGSMWCGTLQ